MKNKLYRLSLHYIKYHKKSQFIKFNILYNPQYYLQVALKGMQGCLGYLYLFLFTTYKSFYFTPNPIPIPPPSFPYPSLGSTGHGIGKGYKSTGQGKGAVRLPIICSKNRGWIVLGDQVNIRKGKRLRDLVNIVG